jgi:DNA ligase 1
MTGTGLASSGLFHLVLSQIFTNMNLKSLLGEKYEEAQMKLKNPDVPPPSKSKAPISVKKTPASKAKSTADKKRKKVDDEDDEDGDHVEEAQEEKPKTKKMTAPKSKGKAAAVIEADDHEEIKAEQKHEDEGKEGVKESSDELAEINGIKPKVYLEDGAEREVSSMSRYGLSFL